MNKLLNFPLKIGNRWTARLHIQEGWGDWEDTHKYSEYEIVDRETIKTDLGKIECYKLRPQLVVDRVFKDEDDMTIWVSADANKIPIRVQANIYVGSVKVDITKASGLKNKFSSKK